MKKITVGVSNRHIHLSQEDLEVLFGKGHVLTPTKDLTQPGQYACEETVQLVGPKSTFPSVRVLGPTRKQTQIEISVTDSFALGIKNVPIRDSGDLKGSQGCKLVGPAGEVDLTEGVIVAKRHIHMTTEQAKYYGVKDKDLVSVRTVENDRQLTFSNVLVRVSDSYALEMHVDIDEANAALLRNGDQVELVK